MPYQNVTYELVGFPVVAQRLDEISKKLADPISRKALKAGGKIVQAEAELQVHRLTGALAEDIVVVTRVKQDAAERYVLIGPGWDPQNYRRAHSRRAGNRAASPDQTTNPGVYGYFLEVGHRGPGRGLRNLPDYRRDARLAKKQGKKVDTSKYGTITVPAYPWLRPAFEATKDEAFQRIGEIVKSELKNLSFASSGL